MPDVRRRDLGWLALAAGLGALVGLTWALWAPRDVLKIVNGIAVPDAMQSESYIAADGIAARRARVLSAGDADDPRGAQEGIPGAARFPGS